MITEKEKIIETVNTESAETAETTDTAVTEEKHSSENSFDTGLAAYKSIYAEFVKWLAVAIIVGIFVGIAGAAFHHALDFATEFRTEHPIIMLGLPLAGLIIVFLYNICGMKDDKGTNSVILEARGNKNVSILLAPLIFTATFLTHLCGGSAGREGAALQMGASLASPLRKLLKLDPKDSAELAMCGMAAGFSALFGTPIAAAVFAMEVTIVGAAQYTAIVPCILSAVTATITAGIFGVTPTAFNVLNVPAFSENGAVTLLKVLLLGILCALVSILFCEAMHIAGKLYQKYIKNPYLRVLAGSAIVLLLTLILGTYDYNGAGVNVIERAFAGEAFPLAFLIKILLTALTLGAGFKGGEIVPSFFVGATLGCAASHLIGLDPSFGAAVGLLAVFCGVTNCPLATIILGIELFGAQGLVFYAAAIAVSYMLSGYQGLYSAQVFYLSKSRLEWSHKAVRDHTK
ncbi:MAG: chloride channel protein [Oscillospiraceae bacterium]|nr:chloride channel protein [Oscillospiraceae bacterium]